MPLPMKTTDGLLFVTRRSKKREVNSGSRGLKFPMRQARDEARRAAAITETRAGSISLRPRRLSVFHSRMNAPAARRSWLERILTAVFEAQEDPAALTILVYFTVSCLLLLNRDSIV